MDEEEDAGDAQMEQYEGAVAAAAAFVTSFKEVPKAHEDYLDTEPMEAEFYSCDQENEEPENGVANNSNGINSKELSDEGASNKPGDGNKNPKSDGNEPHIIGKSRGKNRRKMKNKGKKNLRKRMKNHGKLKGKARKQKNRKK